jgi:hypothetical protein
MRMLHAQVHAVAVLILTTGANGIDGPTPPLRAGLNVCFDEDEATWKRQLLRLHQSRPERHAPCGGV